MADDKIIKFDKLQDKMCDHEYDKFEQYLSEKNMEFTSGKISLEQLISDAGEYLKGLESSGIKMVDFQKKMMEKIGINPDEIDLEKELKDIKEKYNIDDSMTSHLKEKAFFDVYSNIEKKTVHELKLKNSKNDLKVIFDKNIVVIVTEKKVDFSDDELNEMIMLYRQCVKGDLKIISCEATNIYEYH